MTVGASFLSQTIALQDSTTVKFEIWDTAGQERYYWQNIASCVLVSMTSTFLLLINPWVLLLQRILIVDCLLFRYAALAPLYYRGAAVAVIVYDITSPDTFNKAQYWVKVSLL